MTRLRRISPPRDQLEHLRTPLNAGERRVFELFDAHLAPAWEIYVQPHLNGQRPDFVLLNPNAGVAVFEVKDWSLDAMDYWVEKGADGMPRLMARNPDGVEFPVEDPLAKAALYRYEIGNLYCPRLDATAGLSGVTAGVLFPRADHERLRKLLHPLHATRAKSDRARDHLRAIGREPIDAGDIGLIFPDYSLIRSGAMSEELAADLRHWLEEPEFSAEQRRPPVVDERKQLLIQSRTDTGFRRVRGPAGSGKTTVVAGRAGQLQRDGRDVLVVTYNHSLIPWLRDLTNRFGGRANEITWLNFHDWCKRVLYEAGRSDEYDALWRKHHERAGRGEDGDLDDMLAEQLPTLVHRALEDSYNEVGSFDAILVDEGQDFLPTWWAALRRVLRPGGEMLLTADVTQDLYERADRWTDEAMIGAGFGGRWSELEFSYRMPRALSGLARDFADEYLTTEDPLLPLPPDQQELTVEPCTLRWVQVPNESLVDAAAEEIRAMVAKSGSDLDTGEVIPFADVVFVCDRRADGAAISSALSERGVRTLHTFAVDSRESRRQKRFFFKGDARVKGTTVHSFRGWEGRALVLTITGNGAGAGPIVYSGLTRLRSTARGSHLTVVCATDSYAAYGSGWPDYVDRRPTGRNGRSCR